MGGHPEVPIEPVNEGPADTLGDEPFQISEHGVLGGKN